MIYKQKQLKRMASEMLAKDLLDNKDFHFTNTSYGGRGERFGTIEAENSHEEHLIEYSLIREGSWADEKFNLVRTTEDTYYKTADRDFRKEQNQEIIIKNLYEISHKEEGPIYTDNEACARDAWKKQGERSNRKVVRFYGSRSKTFTLKPNTPMYDKAFEKLSREKAIKYGVEISYHVYYQDAYRYDRSYTYKIGITKVTGTLCTIYRNKSFAINTFKVTYDNPNAEY